MVGPQEPARVKSRGPLLLTERGTSDSDGKVVEVLDRERGRAFEVETASWSSARDPPPPATPSRAVSQAGPGPTVLSSRVGQCGRRAAGAQQVEDPLCRCASPPPDRPDTPSSHASDPSGRPASRACYSHCNCGNGLHCGSRAGRASALWAPAAPTGSRVAPQPGAHGPAVPRAESCGGGEAAGRAPPARRAPFLPCGPPP